MGGGPARPGIEVSISTRSRHVIDALAGLINVERAACYPRPDNAAEYVSRVTPRWLAGFDIDSTHIDLGKPWQNAANQRFAEKFREE